jgi:hypothetical protein
MAAGEPSVHPLQQPGRRDAQGAGEPNDVFDAGVACSALDAADVGLVKVSPLSQSLLGEVFAFTPSAKALAEGDKDRISFRNDR